LREAAASETPFSSHAGFRSDQCSNVREKNGHKLTERFERS
jgi:hypothetical protein